MPNQSQIIPDQDKKDSPLSEIDKERIIRVIDYLLEIAQIRSKTIKDIQSYQPFVLWMDEIPIEKKYCFTQAWGVDAEYDSDVWLEVNKYDEPVLDEMPSICRDWVDSTKLYNTEEMPELLPTITVKNSDKEPPEIQMLNLEDFPKISEAWDDYVLNKWFPWADLHKKWQLVQDVYSKLFTIYQEQQRLGEEYELIIGLGFLTWKTPTGQIAKRHMIRAQASLNFEARLGKFIVTPSIEGAQLEIELDMLEIEEQPANKQSIIDALHSTSDNPWDRTAIDPIITALTNLLADKGQGEYYRNSLEPTNPKAHTKPIVDFAPALILRKRSPQGLVHLLQEIKTQINDSKYVPANFLDLCEIDISGKNYQKSNEKSITNIDQTIYFPLLSNERQQDIIHRTRFHKGVLVQGPPGTGKTHTIANLICHFLATGNRVLVTAKTPRALQVLHEKLPKKLQPLCINLLGSGLEEQESLKVSVNNILVENQKWNMKFSNEKIKTLLDLIHKHKKEKAEIDFRIRSIRESETMEQSIIECSYQGRAADIAKSLIKETKQFSWFADDIQHSQTLPINTADLNNLHHILCIMKSADKTDINLIVPDPEQDFPSVTGFRKLVREYNDFRTKYKSLKTIIDRKTLHELKGAKTSAIEKLITSINTLKATVVSLNSHPQKWIETAIYEVLTGNFAHWQELHDILSEKLDGLKERARKIDGKTVSFHDTIDMVKLLQDAKSLKKHLDNGGKIGWGVFKAKIVKDCHYIIKEVTVEGHPCKSSVALQELTDYLDTHQTIEYCWNLLAGKVEHKSGPASVQVAELEEQQKKLSRITELHKTLHTVEEAILNIHGLAAPIFYDIERLDTFINSCIAAIVKVNLTEATLQLKKNIKQVETFTSQPEIHPIGQVALAILKKGRINEYSSVLEKMFRLRKQKKQFEWVNEIEQNLSTIAPIFTKELFSTPTEKHWKIRLNNFEKAWNWKRGCSWINDFICKEDLPGLERQSIKISEQLNEKMSELIALKAWKNCFNRMGDHHRRHLMGWQQQIKKIGKGTGKHAPKHRKTARRHLNECKEAVPAWIMPLHRVYETVQATPGTFDVIIVDEASQCGPEALPLMYLSNQLVVVGDDQQISPEAVGIDPNKINHLINEKLKGLDHSDSFELDTSLFDHSKRRYGSPIVLQEHFRCMPEIIRFSNDLCYIGTPLIPLRQYPPDRLLPLIKVHVQEGYREGKYNRAVNRPEAERIVDKIIQCCNEDIYEGKTMGVISLHGEAQASLIEDLLLKQLGASEMEQRRLICGNPYSFQGDERDIIFLSMVAAENHRTTALTKQGDKRRFNVAASRAKDQMWLFHSITPDKLSDQCLRKKLINHFQNPDRKLAAIVGHNIEELQKHAYRSNRKVEDPPRPFDSWFELDVALKIAEKGYRIISQYPVIENKRIDIVVEDEKRQLAVECDGDYWHGPEQYESDMERQRMLERCGWRFVRIRESAFYINPDAALDMLWEDLNYLGIKPILANAESDKSPNDLGTDTDTSDSSSENKSEKSKQDNFKKTESDKSNKNKFHRISNIKEALSMKPSQLREEIIDVLKKRPNNSCVKDALTGLVLKQLGILSRGKPREQFGRKINQVLNYMENRKIIKTYKAKNVRIRLVKTVHQQADIFQ